MGARWYDAGLRRFLSPDPLGIDGGFNLYAYADADPANRIDPLGLCAQSSGRGIVDNVRYAPDREYDGRLGYVARTQGFAAAAVLGISDILGLSAIGEFYTGRDFSTGKYLSSAEVRSRGIQTVLAVATYAFSMVRIAPAARAAPVAAKSTITDPARLLTGSGKLADHHVFPQQFRGWFKERGLQNIDNLTVTVDHNVTHLRAIHGAGNMSQMPGRWNAQWAEFIKSNPNASSLEVYQQAGRMMDDFGIGHIPIHPYKAP